MIGGQHAAAEEDERRQRQRSASNAGVPAQHGEEHNDHDRVIGPALVEAKLAGLEPAKILRGERGAENRDGSEENKHGRVTACPDDGAGAHSPADKRCFQWRRTYHRIATAIATTMTASKRCMVSRRLGS